MRVAACYAETFLITNAVVDAGLLLIASALKGGRIRPIRILLGALLGAVCALFSAALGGALRSLWAQGLVSLLMVLTVVGNAAWREKLRLFGALWLSAAILGGMAALGIPLFIAGIATGVAGMAIVRRKNAPLAPCVKLTIRQGEVIHSLNAIVDTGNRVLDPLTGLPVILVDEGLFPIEQKQVVCVRTAAGTRLLSCFQPDELFVDGSPMAAMVALAPEGMLERALVPWALCPERKVA